jgi:hypothetical protein
MGGKGDLIAEFIRENNVKKFVEVGVYKGKMIGYIMKQCADTINEYWGVDRWEVCDDYVNKSEEDWKSYKWWSYKIASKWPNKVSLINMHSSDAASLFDDEYFDFVFIDAEHTYEPMLEYIRDWLPKVKRGRFFGGHDYAKRYGVYHAVNEVFVGREIHVLPYECWYVQI